MLETVGMCQGVGVGWDPKVGWLLVGGRGDSLQIAERPVDTSSARSSARSQIDAACYIRHPRETRAVRLKLPLQDREEF